MEEITLYGYNDIDNLETLYVHTGDSINPSTTTSFESTKKGIYQNFRLKLTKQTSNPATWHLIIGAIDFFGSVTNAIVLSCSPKNFNYIVSIFLL